MIPSHVKKMDLIPVKTAAKAKFLAYLSSLSISFRMLYDATESKIFFQKLGRLSDDAIFMSRVPKFFFF